MRVSDWSSDVCSSDLLHAPIGLQLHVAADQSLGVDQAPVAEARAEPQAGGVLDERLLVDRAKQAAALEIGRHHRHDVGAELGRSEEHTSELQSLMRISYAVFCLKKKNTKI